jgi:hypothetical protein
MLWILEVLQSLSENDLTNNSIDVLIKKKIAYIEVERFVILIR